MRFHCDLIELRARSRPEDRRRSPAKARGSYYRMEHRGETNDRLIASFSIPNPLLQGQCTRATLFIPVNNACRSTFSADYERNNNIVKNYK